MNISEKEKFNKAFQLHSDGILDQAETVYNEILGENPNNAEVLNLLGILKLSQNKLEEAVGGRYCRYINITGEENGKWEKAKKKNDRHISLIIKHCWH